MNKLNIIYLSGCLLGLGATARTASANDFVTTTPGRAPDARATLKQSKVPRIRIYSTNAAGEEVVRLKVIPQIDIGREPALQARPEGFPLRASLPLPFQAPPLRRSPPVSNRHFLAPPPQMESPT